MKFIGIKIRNSFTKMLNLHLPKRTKRLVFLASLTARLKGSSAFDDKTFNKLNQIMCLASSDSALKLPVQLSKVIWQGRTQFDIRNEAENIGAFSTDCIARITNKALKLMPDWLRYDDDLEIEKDIETLFHNSEILLG